MKQGKETVYSAAREAAPSATDKLIAELIEEYSLEPHREGGWFAEVYTSVIVPEIWEVPDTTKESRPMAGSIYYLLDKAAVSHFHTIDCEELWYYHQGCGMRIYVVQPDGEQHIWQLGIHRDKGEQPMIFIPKGSIFAAENLDKELFTLVSCVTVPKFRYSGFRMISRQELPGCSFPSRLFSC